MRTRENVAGGRVVTRCRAQVPRPARQNVGSWEAGLSAGYLLPRIACRTAQCVQGFPVGPTQHPGFTRSPRPCVCRRLITQLPSSHEAAPRRPPPSGPPRAPARPAPAALGPGRPEPPPGECAGCSGVCQHQGKAAGRPGSEGRGAPPPLCPYPQSSATLPALCLKAPAPRPALTPGGVVCGNT